jgi:hypothetical protein
MKITRLMTTGGATVLIALGASTGTAAAIEVPERDSGAAVMLPGPPNYPEYDPMYELTPVAAQGTGVDASSAALGALAGIALAGAGLGAAFAVARHRDHPAAPLSV